VLLSAASVTRLQAADPAELKRAMEELKKDPTVHNRVRVMTLLSIDSQANKMAFREAYVIEFLVAALQDREPEVRSTAVLALQTILERLEDHYDSLKRYMISVEPLAVEALVAARSLGGILWTV